MVAFCYNNGVGHGISLPSGFYRFGFDGHRSFEGILMSKQNNSVKARAIDLLAMSETQTSHCRLESTSTLNVPGQVSLLFQY